MYEKSLEFKMHSLDVNNGEQYSEYYLQLSPSSEIPILQDNALIIAGTNKIIKYLDLKYSDQSIGEEEKKIIWMGKEIVP